MHPHQVIVSAAADHRMAHIAAAAAHRLAHDERFPDVPASSARFARWPHRSGRQPFDSPEYR